MLLCLLHEVFGCSLFNIPLQTFVSVSLCFSFSSVHGAAFVLFVLDANTMQSADRANKPYRAYTAQGKIDTYRKQQAAVQLDI